jgi:hypothetical protein
MHNQLHTQNIILYPAGCYGTFFEWVLNFLQNPELKLPFDKTTGNSHEFRGNFLFPPAKLFNHVNSKNRLLLSRTHPGLFEEINQQENCYQDSYDVVLQKNLNFLKNYFDKVLIVTYDQNSVLWCENNSLEKILVTDSMFETNFQPYGYTKNFMKSVMTQNPIERLKHVIDLEVNSTLSPFTKKNLLGWHKNNIYDFDVWELRELLSFYWFTRSQGQIEAWVKIAVSNPDVMVISITDLRERFVEVIKDAITYFNIDHSAEQIHQLEWVYQQWVPLQKQIHKDTLCYTIVQSLCEKKQFDWSDVSLSIIDESWIQKQLRDHNIEIRCDKLNVFPTNTQDFEILLIRR